MVTSRIGIIVTFLTAIGLNLFPSVMYKYFSRAIFLCVQRAKKRPMELDSEDNDDDRAFSEDKDSDESFSPLAPKAKASKSRPPAKNAAKAAKKAPAAKKEVCCGFMCFF